MKFLWINMLFLLALSSQAAARGDPKAVQDIIDNFYHVMPPVPDVGTVQKVLFGLLNIRPSHKNRTDPPPRHMLELYQYFLSREVATQDPDVDVDTVVRSINPLPDYYRKNVLVFNMSSLAPIEEVFSAQLHLRRRRISRRTSRRHQRRMSKTLDPPMQVRLLRVSPLGNRRPINLATYPVAASERGWRILDVTAAVREASALPATGSSKQRYLGIRFEKPSQVDRRKGKKFIPVGINEFLLSKCETEDMAYLVIYTKESEYGSESDENEDYREPLDTDYGEWDLEEEDVGKDDNDINPMLPNSFGKFRKIPSPESKAGGGDDRVTNKIGPSVQYGTQDYGRKGKQRLGRSLSDNELPEIDEVGPTATVHPGKEPGNGTEDDMATHLELYFEGGDPMQGATGDEVKREEVRRQREGMEWLEGNVEVTTKGVVEDIEGKEEALKKTEPKMQEELDARDVVAKGSRKGTGGSRKRDKGRRPKISDSWQNFGEPKNSRRKVAKTPKVTKTLDDGSTKASGKKPVKGAAAGWGGRTDTGSCSVHSYIIDFHELGWSNWLYGPRLFHSSFCAGMCPHPVVKDFYSSTHATVQSLFNALRRRDEKRQETERYSLDWEMSSSFLRNRRALLRAQAHDPCCVPNLFAPLSLLYVDENEDIILKSFPSLRVLGCSCI